MQSFSRNALVAFGLAGALTAAAPVSPMITQAKKIIAAEMVDPASLRYRNVRIIHSTIMRKHLTITCGEFNAHNRMGGYMGYTTFAYEATVMRGVVSRSAEGSMEFFGDSDADRSDEATEAKARIIAACLGVKLTD